MGYAVNPSVRVMPSPQSPDRAPGAASKSLAFRDASDDDYPFVIDSWLRSFRTSFASGPLSRERSNDAYRGQIADVMSRPKARTVVAYHPAVGSESLADIYGWACCENPQVIHYVFTKQGFRRLGIARLVIAAAGVDLAKPYVYAFRTPVVTKIGHRLGRWDALFYRREVEDKNRSKRDESAESATAEAGYSDGRSIAGD